VNQFFATNHPALIFQYSELQLTPQRLEKTLNENRHHGFFVKTQIKKPDINQMIKGDNCQSNQNWKQIPPN